MRLLTAAIFLAAGLGTASYAAACPNKDKGEHQTAKASSIEVDDAAKLAKAGKIVMIDANKTSTRKEQGVVPGARLLSSYRDFDAKELGADKSATLVFYCHSESCGAAPAAAKRAAKLGFESVKVMDAGIVGWKKAGHPVKTI